MKDAGKLDQRVFEKEFSKDNMQVIKILGFTALTIGVLLIIAIVYTLIAGGVH